MTKTRFILIHVATDPNVEDQPGTIIVRADGCEFDTAWGIEHDQRGFHPEQLAAVTLTETELRVAFLRARNEHRFRVKLSHVAGHAKCELGPEGGAFWLKEYKYQEEAHGL